mmetsp:Transcript_10597/g.21374  ORF Transcript_10597/g.21374 Transcript_10597/m.21374 type:complete len:215 (-) Transcript_10597:3055-3699(-)|eukprot:CAMPEP_0178685496 /NCGR_PEP_ID=MMETSP0699-20121125/3418_1 /TAXON_ID=265572 /ORGANISM="Extubocellulus spinifer, Strain CCMP396" /LENGTH=214 /DNA_ID=CAMNT_0020330261 /DNA_START=51 /DNA_END=695 /DNA_ORIENTATION=+
MDQFVAVSFLLLALLGSGHAFVAPSRHALLPPGEPVQSTFISCSGVVPAQRAYPKQLMHHELHILPPPVSSTIDSVHFNDASASLSHHVSSMLVAAAQDIGIDEAFTDEIDLFGDPLVQKMVGAFGVVIVVLLAANALLGQMDGAIRNVLGDFEQAMRTRYASRWIEIEEELEGLGIDSETESPERTEALMKIMERMEREEPAMMERVNAEMGT